MKHLYPGLPGKAISFYLFVRSAILGTIISVVCIQVCAQSVSGIITDYNGYWKTSVSNVSAIKPVNSHNLLAFTYNNLQYSTGVDDLALSSQGETFIAGDFWSLPLSGFTGTISPNTKVGVGQMYDGINNGPGITPPLHSIAHYLSDGIKGLNIGTGIANLPAGNMSFNVNTINPSHIGDGIPDILVTQIADPSGSTDGYAFTDPSGNIVGHKKNIVFTSITPVANWTADFYEASTKPLTLTNGFTNTDRPLRLWAADLADFGITESNYSSIQKFNITLSGNSDVAFVAYNSRSFNVITLPVSLLAFSGRAAENSTTLSWTTAMEEQVSRFVIEKSSGSGAFTAIGEVKAAGYRRTARQYRYTDRNSYTGIRSYRLKMVYRDGSFTYSKIITLHSQSSGAALQLYPNPASDQINLVHPETRGAFVQIHNAAGNLLIIESITPGRTQTQISLKGLQPGIYQLTWYAGSERVAMQFLRK
jgi:hypothetical protein